LTERASSQSADQALRRFRRLDGAVDIGGRGERHFSDVVLVGGVEAIDPAAFPLSTSLLPINMWPMIGELLIVFATVAGDIVALNCIQLCPF
jgi:hypothetical protein